MTTERKRARTTGGKFRGDDPSTPAVNEAWEDTTVATKKAPAKKPAAKTAAPKKSISNLPHPSSAAYKAMIIRGEIKE